RRVWPVPQAELVRGDGAGLPFRNGAFDLVTSNLGVNNFADAAAAIAECRRVLDPGGCLALTTNLEGHFAELYGLLAEGLSERGDEAALERLRAHVDHRGTIASLTGRLERGGFGVESVHERQVAMRFGSGAAVLTHHFMRLGFVPGWREVAGAAAE